MAFEMICGQCRGNLLVEQFGVVVACPHCGAHLSIPAPPGATPPPAISAPAPVPPPPPAPVPIPTLASIAPNTPAPVSSVPTTPPVVEEIAATTVMDEQVPFFGLPAIEPVATSEAHAPASAVVETTSVDPAELFGAVSKPHETTNQVPHEAQTAIEEPSVATSEPSEHESSHPLDALFGASEETPVASAEPLVSESLTSETPLSPAPDHAQSAPQAETSSLSDTKRASDAGPESDTGFGALVAQSANDGMDEITPSNSEAPDASDHASVAATDVESSANETAQSTVGKSESPTPAVDSDHVLMAKTSVLLLLSYTSAVTIGFLYLFFHLMNHKDADYGLESLPDVAPLKKGVSILLVPERAEMPDGHDLKIGESQTFGNIKVTVSKVTRGPIQFVHHSRKADEVRLPSSPVLKLWLKFENVSKDQEIPPLDSQLLFSRRGKTRFEWRANQFVCRENDKANTDKRKVYIYDHNFQSPWDLANLSLEKPLKPKESREYYVPSGENDLELLDGSLLWRVHFRKGYGPKGRGVTTIFEVHFDAKEIRDEQA